ncbi:Phosphoethanolamine N-methyltransferase-related protein [Tritrichomonas foetus]|uniref:Phosphoethanolamine N-methyltransferase-related protein n=1 Tax=Tritrichomonas foetus TaxID=1144522 RepID=A0A1J4KYB9_9EUKA|nr:Phosphoethanolamine N-methyltransferase-related protein [Tritrichomonas foetus]|eukprot:OHT16231.1 Phosphoethanolamine N-methyltransferase-related protein [Tritrichomonas foetus]
MSRKNIEKVDEAHGQFDFEYSEEETEDLPEFGETEYWDDRYKKEEDKLFDWYFDWNRVSKLLTQYTNNHKEKVLVLGCGNSPLSADLLDDGFSSVYSIDVSSVVIEKMKEIYKDKKNLYWETMNCAELKYDSNFFDLCLDKGTLDAVVCSVKDQELVKNTLEEVYRTLKPGGFFISITFGPPSRRLPFFNLVKLDWKLLPPFQIKHEDDDERDIHHFVYAFQKP